MVNNQTECSQQHIANVNKVTCKTHFQAKADECIKQLLTVQPAAEFDVNSFQFLVTYFLQYVTQHET
jgi:hypothetical protein